MTPPINASTLRRFCAFAGLSNDDLAALIAQSTSRSYAPGARIIHRGEDGHCMFILLDGKASVSFDGRELDALAPGDFFGEVSLVDDGPRSADVNATEACEVLCVTRTTIGILAATRPEAAVQILAAIGRSLVGKLREDNRRMAELMLLGRSTTTAHSPTPNTPPLNA